MEVGRGVWMVDGHEKNVNGSVWKPVGELIWVEEGESKWRSLEGG